MNLALIVSLSILALLAAGHLLMQYTMTYLLHSRQHPFYNPRMWIPGWFIVNYFRDPLYRSGGMRNNYLATIAFFRQVRAMPKGGTSEQNLDSNPETTFNGGA